MNYPDYSIGGVLVHHGIQGQKWGKRNGPPYPLKPSDHSEAEKRASKGRVTGSSENPKKKPVQSGIFNNRQKVKKLKEMDEDAKAHEMARKAGKDDGDNYKVYRDAMRGDERAKKVIEEWENKSNNNEEKILQTIESKLEKEFKKGKYDSYEEADEYLSKNDKEYRDLHKSLNELNKSKQKPTQSGTENNNSQKENVPSVKKLKKYQDPSDYWGGSDPTDKQIDEYVKLQKKVNKISGDLYESKPVSKGFSEKLKILDEAHNEWRDNKYDLKKRQKVTNAEEDLLGQVLKDLGYPDTPEHRKWIRPVVFWD